MEMLNGGLDCRKVNSRATAGLALGITVLGLVTGGVGAIILGPSAVGLAVAAYQCMESNKMYESEDILTHEIL